MVRKRSKKQKKQKIGKTKQVPYKPLDLDIRIFTPRNLRPNNRYKLFTTILDVLQEGPRSKKMIILHRGDPVPDEQAFLIRQLLVSKRREYDQDDDGYIEWLEKFHKWLGEEVHLEKTGEHRVDDIILNTEKEDVIRIDP